MNKFWLKKQYLMHNTKKKSRLPNDFQEVEYIQGTGTQCIDTGLIPTKANQFELDFSLQEKVNSRLYGMFGGYAFGLNGPNTFWGCGSDLRLGDIFTLNERYILKQDTRTNQATLNIETYNGVNIGNWSQQYSSMSTDVNVFILDMKVAWATIFAPAKAKVYACKIHNGDSLVRDFIPCYRKSDNEVGLYDIVNNQFYTNQGSGSFLMGNEV